MTKISEERLAELMRYHKERAIYFEQMSDNMRHMETYKESLPHWDVYEALRELRAYRKDGWQPIETAPRDGTLILTFEASEGIATSAYRPDLAGNTGYVWFNPDHETPTCPTHWMPLPAAPEPQEEI